MWENKKTIERKEGKDCGRLNMGGKEDEMEIAKEEERKGNRAEDIEN